MYIAGTLLVNSGSYGIVVSYSDEDRLQFTWMITEAYKGRHLMFYCAHSWARPLESNSVKMCKYIERRE